MILDEQRTLHEEIERLEQAIAERVVDEPKHIRERLGRDHEVASYLDRIQLQSQRLLEIYKDADGEREKEIQLISTGDPSSIFYTELAKIKDFHRRNPNEAVDNLERAYKRRPGDGDISQMHIETMFTGEEGYGRFFDLTSLHEDYLNLPGIKGGRRITYLQYLDSFDKFSSIKLPDKLTDLYFTYLGALASYLEGFMRRTKPLEDLDRLFKSFSEEFEKAWEAGEVEGWAAAGPATQGAGTGIWCPDCKKEFNNENVYNHHLTSKKHVRAAAARKESEGVTHQNGTVNGTPNGVQSVQRQKERAIAEREFRVKKLASAMQTERSDTRVNVERKQGMTDRERQQELEALFQERPEPEGGNDGSESEGEDKIYNPLKLPLAWDGKPIPFWLYKLHGLGVEFPCEVCGNFVYMGRRAFDKHFNEARHIYGLKCLGITNTSLFREITGIEEAQKLWDKIQRDKKKEKSATENVVQMEDNDGNVMPEKVYQDLLKQGLL